MSMCLQLTGEAHPSATIFLVGCPTLSCCHNPSNAVLFSTLVLHVSGACPIPQAARQQQGGGGVDAGPKRPALKRPTSHRPAPPRDADAAVAKRPRADGDAPGGDSARFEPREEQGAHRTRDGWSGDRAQERGQDQG